MYQNSSENEISNREYMASAFTTYFGNPSKAADLYCALSHTEDVKPEDIEFNTLQGTLFMELLIPSRSMYRTSLIQLSTPEFYVEKLISPGSSS